MGERRLGHRNRTRGLATMPGPQTRDPVPRGAKQSSGLGPRGPAVRNRAGWEEALEGRVGSLPPAPGPVASPSGLCPQGRCASERSRRVWAGGARGGASPQPCCYPRRSCCCHGPVAPRAVPGLQPGGGRPRLHSPNAAPRPWRMSAWSRPQSPAPAREGQPRCRPLLVAARWLLPSAWSLFSWATG